MTKRIFLRCLLAGMLAGTWVGSRAQGATGGASAVKRPMTFADLQRMKRVSDPQISPSGKWVMFSATEVDLDKNTKVNHLWVVPIDGGRERPVTFWKEGESGGRFSPDGRQVLFVSADGGTSLQIYLATWNESQGTLGTPRRLTNVSTEADGAIWSPDSQRILFTSRVYPECSEGSSWLEEDNCDRRKDADAAANPVKAQTWDHLLYRHWNGFVGPKRSHVLVVSATDGNMVRDLTPREDIWDAEAPTFSMGGPIGYAWAPDSKEIAYVTNLDLVPAVSTNNDVFTLRLDTPGAKPLKVSMSLGSDDAPAYSPDGKWLAFRSQSRAGYESDRFRLMLLDRETMKAKELSSPGISPKFDLWIDEFAWQSPDLILFTSADQGEEAIRTIQTGGEFEQKVLSKDGEFSEINIRNDNVVASRTLLNEPTEIVKFAGGEMTQITHLNNALLSHLDLPNMESFWFPGAGGTKVQGFIVRPPNFDENKKYPMKFLIHGGPQGAWGDAWSYRWNPELMAATGYVVVMVNPRGSTGYGQAFVDGVNGDWGGKAYVDLMRGLDYAEKQYPFIDKTRECALGGSYGGFMADWILTHTSRFACIVTHDGMFNPQSAYGDTEELWFNEWEFRAPVMAAGPKGHGVKQIAGAEPAQPWNYFDKPVAEDPFRKWSPMLSIKNARTPTLVIHSQRDYRLDVSEGFQLFTALQRLNVPSKMLYFPDEGHWVLKPQNSKLWYETVGDWCDKWTKTNAYALTGYESPPTPFAAATTKVSGGRTGVSRPAEDEEKPSPEKAIVPPVAETKTPERVPEPVIRSAPVMRAAPVTPPPSPRPRPSAPIEPSPHQPPPSETSHPAAAPPPTVAAEKPADAGNGHASFLIAISAPNDEIQVGSDARIVITLRNLAEHQILFAHRPGANNPEFSYTIHVRNAAGHPVEETAYGREARVHPQTENRTVDYVQPGMTTVQTAHLGRLVSLNRPGRYTVRVSRRDPESGAVVESNEITLNVVP